MERRKKHLRQQRDRLMAKKKKDRERKLDEYKEAKEPPKEPVRIRKVYGCLT